MQRDDDSPPSEAGVPVLPALRAARAQFESARLRRKGLVASGKLADSALEQPVAKRRFPGYILHEELRRGGQGIVYVATQESTGRQVAVKVLHGWSPGSASTRLARFQREVDVLSRMKHPTIVTIHDCGRVHDDVYLVMDYVSGCQLDAHVERHKTPLRETLALFARICDGVSAAHLRGVIHRDLKPGNILVDDTGEPRLLDFGLAKLVDDPSSAKSDGASRPTDAVDAASATATAAMTITGQFVGSLPWASPEQAEGRIDEVDIRTDVYSLGVVFYQVLTGRFPYPVSGRLDAVVRNIAKAEPARPAALRGDINRELETILLKCLAKEPERRYQSAGELARDIRRYLAGEPVEARRDSLAYIMAKQLKRYRVAGIGAAILLLVVLSALFVSLGLWKRAEAQRSLAQQNAARADQEADQARAISEFMREVLTTGEPENQGADVRLIQVLASASRSASARFAGHPLQEAQVRDLLGQIYQKLTLWVEAQAEFERAADLYRQHAGPDDTRALDVQAQRISAALNMGQTASAEQVLNDQAPRLTRLFGPDAPRVLEARRQQAVVLLQRGRIDESERMLTALRSHPALINDDAAQARLLVSLVGVHHHRLSSENPEERRAILARAMPDAREWVERTTRLHGPASVHTLLARVKLADMTCEMGRYLDAAAGCRAVLDGSAERLGECHHIRTNAMYILAEALARSGEVDEPAELHWRRIQCERQKLPKHNLSFLSGLSDSLRYFERAGRAADGESIARELIEALQSFGGTHGDMDYVPRCYLAHFTSMQGRLDAAETLFAPLLDAERQQTESRTRARIHLFYGAHLMRRGSFAESEQELLRAAGFLGDIRIGTWYTHSNDLILAFIALYDAWGKPEKAAEYQRMR